MLLALASPASMAQGASAANSPAVPVVQQQSVVALNGPWKFHVGDNREWVDPSFDDSGWEQYELAPGIKSLTPKQALQMGELPGWQHHGHPGYSGYAWYRIRLNIEPHSQSLALLMPIYVEEAYEVYLNGHLIGKFGKLDGFKLVYLSQPELFPIPADVANPGQANTLAIRFWTMPWQALPRRLNLYGGFRSLPMFGSSDLLTVFKESWVYDYDVPLWAAQVSGLDGIVGLISIFLFFFSRRQREYLWAGIGMCSWAVAALCGVAMNTQQTQIPYQLSFAVQWLAGWIGVFSIPVAAMYLLGVPRKVWKQANYFVSLLNLVKSVVSLGIIFGFVPPNATFEAIDTLLKVTPSILGCLLVLIAIDGIRTVGRTAWLLMAPGLFFGARLIFRILADPDFVRTSPEMDQLLKFAVRVSDICAPLSILVIFLLRFARQQRENGRMLEDMRQAREVQQLMIPEKLPEVPWLRIESEYRPAREVGGDFFQIIPVAADDSVLIVAGDVTGKGLQAGMLVAMLIGAIRTESGHTSDPARILGALNSRLQVREHAYATCLALRIASDGRVSLANAGHLPPYLNGEPIEMSGALPLGMIESAESSVAQFQLKLGDRLVLVSDGIVEATNDSGSLFGFERLQSLLRTSKSAGEVASTAQIFGQEDDISVIAITHTGAAVPALV